MYSNRRTRTWLSDIKALEVASSERKYTQPIGGDSLKSYKTFKNSLNDFSFNITEANPLRIIRLTFTHNTSTRGALLSLKVFASTNSDVMPNAIPYFVGVMPSALVRWKKDMQLSDGSKTVWNIAVAKGNSGVPAFNVYFKFYIDGTDKGDWVALLL